MHCGTKSTGLIFLRTSVHFSHTDGNLFGGLPVACYAPHTTFKGRHLEAAFHIAIHVHGHFEATEVQLRASPVRGVQRGSSQCGHHIVPSRSSKCQGYCAARLAAVILEA